MLLFFQISTSIYAHLINKTGRARKVSAEKRAQMVILHRQKMSHSNIAEVLRISKTALRTGLARATELGPIKARKRSYRSWKTSVTPDYLTRSTVVAHPIWFTSQILANTTAEIRTRTV